MGHHALRNWVLQKIALWGACLSICMIVGFGLGLVPKPIVDAIGWTAANFVLLAFLFCFSIGAYVALKIIGRSHGK